MVKMRKIFLLLALVMFTPLVYADYTDDFDNNIIDNFEEYVLYCEGGTYSIEETGTIIHETSTCVSGSLTNGYLLEYNYTMPESFNATLTYNFDNGVYNDMGRALFGLTMLNGSRYGLQFVDNWALTNYDTKYTVSYWETWGQVDNTVWTANGGYETTYATYAINKEGLQLNIMKYDSYTEFYLIDTDGTKNLAGNITGGIIDEPVGIWLMFIRRKSFPTVELEYDSVSVLDLGNSNINFGSVALSTNDEDHTNNDYYNFTYTVDSNGDYYNCSLNFNDSYVSTNYNDTINYSYYDISNYEEGNYSYYVRCYDYYNNTVYNTTETYNLIIDRINPDFELKSFVNNTLISSSEVDYIYLHDTFDDLYLYQINYTLKYQDGTIVYNDYNSNVGAQWHNISKVLYTEDLANGTYTLVIDATDTHTKKEIKKLPYSVKDKGLKYYTNKNEINIDYLGDDLNYVNTEKEKDRYTFEFDFKNAGNKQFKVSCEEKAHIQNDLYPYPLINCGKWGIDFNYNDNGTVNYTYAQLDDYTYIIELLTSEKKNFKFKSLVGLNSIHEEYTFRLVNEDVSYMVIDGLNSAFDVSGVENKLDNLGVNMMIVGLIIACFVCFGFGLVFNNEFWRFAGSIICLPLALHFIQLAGYYKLFGIMFIGIFLANVFKPVDAETRTINT